MIMTKESILIRNVDCWFNSLKDIRISKKDRAKLMKLLADMFVSGYQAGATEESKVLSYVAYLAGHNAE